MLYFQNIFPEYFSSSVQIKSRLQNVQSLDCNNTEEVQHHPPLQYISACVKYVNSAVQT